MTTDARDVLLERAGAAGDARELFAAAEVAARRRAVEPACRGASRTGRPGAGCRCASPEVMLFGPTGALVARTHGAGALVDQYPREPGVDVGEGVQLPLAAATLLVAARAVAKRRMSGVSTRGELVVKLLGTSALGA